MTTSDSAYGGRAPVVRLNDATFADWAERRAPITMVLVRSASCAQSVKLEPMMDEVATRHRGSVRVATLDMDEAPETLKRHEVDGVPTILLLREGRRVGIIRNCAVAVSDLDASIARAQSSDDD